MILTSDSSPDDERDVIRREEKFTYPSPTS
jgi:hypothetical protein